jgi:hypothetical protein
MIQRLQSVFLLLVAILGIVIFLFPIATYLSDIAFFKFFICSVRDYSRQPFGDEATQARQFPMVYTSILAVLQLIIAVLAFVTIFKFRNRSLQIRLNYLNIFLSVLLVGGIFYYSTMLEKQYEIMPQYGVGGLFPLVTIILLFLANHFIQKDEKLIRSADRLR